MSYPLSDEAAAAVEGWPPSSRALLEELFEDAGSDLQREFLSRSIGARRSLAEVHAFADELRALTDEQAYAACTVDRATALNHPLEQLLRAEADPLLAFELMGGRIEPNHSAREPRASTLPSQREAAPQQVAPVNQPKRRLPSTKSWSAPLPATPSDAFDAGGRQPRMALKPLTAQSRFAAVLTDETRRLGIIWKEYEIDAFKGLVMREALIVAADALGRGIPVPAFVGARPGEYTRIIVLMQLQASGNTRAWQLYDPLTAELLWTHEANLLAKEELPFANKTCRQLTRIAIPRGKG